MTFSGHFVDGRIVIDTPVSVPNGTLVTGTFEPVPPADQLKTLAERWASLAGLAVDLPPDAAAQHDHYLYGTPKR